MENLELEKQHAAASAINRLANIAKLAKHRNELDRLSYLDIEACCKALAGVLEAHRAIGFDLDYDVLSSDELPKENESER